MLKILTLNMWGKRGPYKERWKEAALRLREIKADVITLQEAMDAPLLEEIARATDLRVALSDCDDTGLAILTHFPSQKHAVTQYRALSPSENYVRKFMSVTIRNGKTNFYLINTHLSWRAHDDEIRKKQALELSNFVKTLEGPVLVAGDFNTEYTSPSLEPLREAGLNDLLDRTPDAKKPTWDNANPFIQSHQEKFPDRRIDLILANGVFLKNEQLEKGGIVFNKPSKPGLYLSDHCAVWVEFD